jgi:hypothetical protein
MSDRDEMVEHIIERLTEQGMVPRPVEPPAEIWNPILERKTS